MKVKRMENGNGQKLKFEGTDLGKYFVDGLENQFTTAAVSYPSVGVSKNQQIIIINM